ncbi:MAG: helix-turn-helix transcriptional regulator, partial [Clostridia bacterium]|nr:helix-turn-helix transcriptional regulator [Clostridia bacterium]
ELAHDGRSPIIEAYLTAFFGKLLKKYSIEKSSVKNDTVLKVLHYCKQHYKEDLSLGVVANELHLSRSTLSHIFSNKLQMNFCDYLNSLRLNEAVALMENKNYSITEISYMSGFSTIRTFNRAFVKCYGKSPSAYRKEM